MNSPRIQASGGLKFDLVPTRPISSLQTHVLPLASSALYTCSKSRPFVIRATQTRNNERTRLGASLSALQYTVEMRQIRPSFYGML